MGSAADNDHALLNGEIYWRMFRGHTAFRLLFSSSFMAHYAASLCLGCRAAGEKFTKCFDTFCVLVRHMMLNSARSRRSLIQLSLRIAIHFCCHPPPPLPTICIADALPCLALRYIHRTESESTAAVRLGGAGHRGWPTLLRLPPHQNHTGVT